MLLKRYKRDILTVEEICELLRICYNAAYKLLNDVNLKGYRNGRAWRIPKNAVIEYIKENAKI